MMKLQIAAALVVAATLGLSPTSANALNKPVSQLQTTPLAQQIACIGNRREYRDFSQCMRVNKNRAARYCNRICQS
jgi:hypothetical protein